MRCHCGTAIPIPVFQRYPWKILGSAANPPAHGIPFSMDAGEGLIPFHGFSHLCIPNFHPGDSSGLCSHPKIPAGNALFPGKKPAGKRNSLERDGKRGMVKEI